VSEAYWYPLLAPHTAAAQVAGEFEQAFGSAPSGVWSAPGRVNLIGEHVDYNGGLCLPFAIAHRTYAALALRPEGTVRMRSSQAPDDVWSGSLASVQPGQVPGWAGYAIGVAWALAADGFDVGGFDLFVDGSVPLGAGLSSSAAMQCAVALGLDATTRDGPGWPPSAGGRRTR
jgi:galactokinase